MDSLTAEIRRARRRIRAALAVKWAAAGLSGGLLIAAVAIGVGGRWWGFLWTAPPLVVAGVAALAGAALGALASAAVRLDDFLVARIVEGHSDLKDRVSSAVWAIRRGRAGSEPLIDDAVRSLRAADLRKGVRIGRWELLRMPTASLAMLTVVILLPSITLFQAPGARQEQLRVREQGAQLRRVAARVRQAPETDRELRERLAARLERLGRQLESGRIGATQARLKLNTMEQTLHSEAERLARKISTENAWTIPGKFARARAQMAGESAERMNAALNRAQSQASANTGLSGNQTPANLPDMDSLQKMNGGAGAQIGAQIPPELVKKLAELYGMKDFQAAAELLEELRKKLGLNPSRAAQKALATDLEALAKALSEADLEELARQLREAAEALKKMDPEEARKLLASACETCNKIGLGLGAARLFSFGANACRVPSGSGNQYASTDMEERGEKGAGNPPDGGRIPGGSRLDKNWTKLYAPRSTANKTTAMKASSQISPKGRMEQLEVEGAPDPAGKSSVPYYEVFPEYRDAAEKALSRDDVPVSERKRVREYFDALR